MSNNRDMKSDGFRNLNHSNAASSIMMRDSRRRPNLNEQTQYSSVNHRYCAKRDSTTLDTTSECP
jgi:hypothetical protein